MNFNNKTELWPFTLVQLLLFPPTSNFISSVQLLSGILAHYCVSLPMLLILQACSSINYKVECSAKAFSDQYNKQRDIRAIEQLPLTLRRQPLIFKYVEAVLFALRVYLSLSGGGCRRPQFIRPLQQSQVVLQRVAQVVAVAAGHNNNVILKKVQSAQSHSKFRPNYRNRAINNFTLYCTTGNTRPSLCHKGQLDENKCKLLLGYIQNETQEIIS